MELHGLLHALAAARHSSINALLESVIMLEALSRHGNSDHLPSVTDHKRMVSTMVCGPFGGIYPYPFSECAPCVEMISITNAGIILAHAAHFWFKPQTPNPKPQTLNLWFILVLVCVEIRTRA